jgi:hypothetical protein
MKHFIIKPHLEESDSAVFWALKVANDRERWAVYSKSNLSDPGTFRCFVPLGFHRSVLAQKCPYIFNKYNSIRVGMLAKDDTSVFPSHCFQEDYDEARRRVLDPNLSTYGMVWAMRWFPMLARNNPLCDLVSLEYPKVRSEMDSDIDSIMGNLKEYNLPESFAMWPERRVDIETYRFPWE